MPEDCTNVIDCCLPLPDEYQISPDTGQLQLTLIADPVGGGEVSGGGLFDRFSNVTIGSTPTPTWSFMGWYDEFGVLFSEEASPTFSLTRNLALTGRFDIL